MRVRFRKSLRSVPAKLWVAIGALLTFLIVGVGTWVLNRTLDRAIPPGEEEDAVALVLKGIRDMLEAVPINWFIVSGATAFCLHLWEKRKPITSGTLRWLNYFKHLALPQSETGLVLSFEPRSPWIQRIPNARTQPKDKAHSHHGPRIETDSLWFRVKISPAPGIDSVQGVAPYLSSVEKFQDGEFAPTDYGAALQLRWANKIQDAFSKIDIHSASNDFIDVLSTDEEHNQVWIKWKERWFSNDHIFDNAGFYRLTVSAIAKNGASAITKLILHWPTQWDQTEMWSEDAVRPDHLTKIIRDILWKQYHEGVKLRNAGSRTEDFNSWEQQYDIWRQRTLETAAYISFDLRNDLTVLNWTVPIPSNPKAPHDHKVRVNVVNEILSRLHRYLTQDLYR